MDFYDTRKTKIPSFMKRSKRIREEEGGKGKGRMEKGNVNKNFFYGKLFRWGVLKQEYSKVLSTNKPIWDQPALKMFDVLKYLIGEYHKVSLTIFLSLYTQLDVIIIFYSFRSIIYMFALDIRL